ncbi:hypothetical protein [Streptomyces narbonensis]
MLDLTRDQFKPVDGRFGPGAVTEARYGLPHATCYGAYLFHEGHQVADDTLVTLVNRCFRNEDHYGGLRRLASFQMREIVAIGSFEHTQQVLARFTERIRSFAGTLGIDLGKVPAGDPFFKNDNGRALLQKLSPVEYEFQYGDLAIASVDTDRTFFGERCGIRLESGEHAYTSCVAFGLERWIAVLTEHFGEDLDAALTAVAQQSPQQRPQQRQQRRQPRWQQPPSGSVVSLPLIGVDLVPISRVGELLDPGIGPLLRKYLSAEELTVSRTRTAHPTRPGSPAGWPPRRLFQAPRRRRKARPLAGHRGPARSRRAARDPALRQSGRAGPRRRARPDRREHQPRRRLRDRGRDLFLRPSRHSPDHPHSQQSATPKGMP